MYLRWFLSQTDSNKKPEMKINTHQRAVGRLGKEENPFLGSFKKREINYLLHTISLF